MNSCEEARFESRVFMTMCGIVVSWIALPHFYSCCWKVQSYTRFVQRKACSCQQDQWNKFENKSWCKLAGSRWIHANLIHFFRRRRGLHEGDLNPLQWSYLTLILLSTQISFALWIEGIFEVCKRRKLDNSNTNRKHLAFVDFEDTVPKDCFYFWHVSSLACLTALWMALLNVKSFHGCRNKVNDNFFMKRGGFSKYLLVLLLLLFFVAVALLLPLLLVW